MLVYFSDNITNWDFAQDVKDFCSSVDPPGSILLVREVENPAAFGVCIIDDNGEVVDIVEKPQTRVSIWP